MTLSPSFRKTFQLGKQKNFNSLLERNDTMFTLFVPTDEAWSKVRQ